jgi:hypothetical protein
MPPPEDWYGRTIAVSAALFLGTLLVFSRDIGKDFGGPEKQVFWLPGLVGTLRGARGSFALLLSSRAQARDLTYPAVLRKIAWTTTHAREVSHRPRGSDDKT